MSKIIPLIEEIEEDVMDIHHYFNIILPEYIEHSAEEIPSLLQKKQQSHYVSY
jgi:hypothetical protein